MQFISGLQLLMDDLWANKKYLAGLLAITIFHAQRSLMFWCSQWPQLNKIYSNKKLSFEFKKYTQRSKIFEF